MLHKEIPFIRLGLPLCAGIVSGLYIDPGKIFLLLFVTIIISGFGLSLLFNKYQTNLLFGITLSISLFFSGLMLFTNEKDSISSLEPERQVFSCTVSDYPEEKENSYRIQLKLNSRIKTNGEDRLKGSIILYNQKDTAIAALLPGDFLIIRCTPVEIVNRGNPYEFDYKFYMENKGIRYIAFTSNHDIISHIIPDHKSLIHRALIVRDKIIEMYKKRGITGENLAVVAAITLGRKNMLDPEQKENFIKAGVIHIMAVSGLHAGILSLFVFNILFFLRGKYNTLRIIITILILWSFAFITGLTNSVLRATLMFSFLHAGKLMKRHVNGINSVLASAFILILIKPTVIFDAGFLLSYSAVIYIISFYNDLYMRLQFKYWFTDKLWQSAVVTIVAQAGTLPLTIMFFNRFPLYFIFTNILIVPLAFLLIITGYLVPITFPIHFLSQFLASILNLSTETTRSLTEFVSALPFSTIEDIGMPISECILLSITIYVSSYFILKKKPFSIIYPLGIMAMLAITCTIREMSVRHSDELIIFNTPGISAIGIRTGKTINIYSNVTKPVTDIEKYCATLGLKKKMHSLQKNFYCIRTGNKTILISGSLNELICKTCQPDFIIITGLPPERKQNFSDVPSTEALIFASGVPSGFYFDQQNYYPGFDTVHIVRKSGAYIKRL